MSKKDLEDLLRRLTYAAYKVSRDCGCRNDLRFKLKDYVTSIGHAKLMRRERRWSKEVDARIDAINQSRRFIKPEQAIKYA